MSYRPKHCCECAEKIERADWNLLTNRRFCLLCETNFGIYDWIPTFVLIFGLIFAAVGVGSFLRKPEKQLAILQNPASADSQNSGRNFLPQPSLPQNSNSNSVQKTTQQNENKAAQPNQTSAAMKQIGKQTALQSISAEEVVYFCGAQTKKGTPCTRRVKNGGRCWQHSGQPAMLPPEKLIAGK